MNKTTFIGMFASFLLGGILAFFVLTQFDVENVGDSPEQSNEPLYWVAPMDPNFRRDGPGKSPMGMDLVPVYQEDGNNNRETTGTVRIDPIVEQNLGVKTEAATEQVLSKTLVTYGDVTLNQDSIVHIHTRVAGWVNHLYVKSEGQQVEKGDPLFTLYSPDLVSAQEEFLLALKQNRQALINAAKSKLEALRLDNEIIERIEKNRKVIADIPVLSPVDGFIQKLNIQEGFFVEPKSTLMAIASLASMWVVADVYPQDLPYLGMNTLATVYFPDSSISSVAQQIDFIYPELDPKSRTAKVRFVLNGPESLPSPNTIARVEFKLEDKNGPVITVPASALIRTGVQDRVVLALGDGRYRSAAVRVGRIWGEMAEILSGVSVGDRVVIAALFLLDSESNVSADLARMASPEKLDGESNMAADSAWTHATVEAVMLDENKVTLSHGELTEFGMPAMQMDFILAPQLDVSELREGVKAHVEIRKGQGMMFEVHTLHILEGESMQSDNEKRQ